VRGEERQRDRYWKRRSRTEIQEAPHWVYHGSRLISYYDWCERVRIMNLKILE